MFRFVSTSLLWALLSASSDGAPVEGALRRTQVAEIVGGTVANHNDYPYFVSLTQGCGGALVRKIHASQLCISL